MWSWQEILANDQYLSYVEAEIPAGVEPGPWDLQFAAFSGKRFVSRVWISPQRPGLYSFNGTGAGIAEAGWVSDPVSNPPRLRLTDPAMHGQRIYLAATGLGIPSSAGSWYLELAGRDVPVDAITDLGSGVAKIEFTVPDDAPADCYVPVRIRNRDVASNTVTIPISREAGTCPHRLGLSRDEIARADGFEWVALGLAEVNSLVSPAEKDYAREESVNVQFFSFLRDGLEYFTRPLPDPVRAGCRLVRTVIAGTGWFRGLRISYASAGQVRTQIPDGRSLTLQNQGTRYLAEIAPVQPAPWSEVPDPSPAGGVWQLNATGSPNGVQAIGLPSTVAPPLRLQNRGSLHTISRSKDYEVAWDGSGYEPDDWLRLTLYGAMPGGSPAQPALSGVQCLAPAADGRLIVSKDLLSRVPEELSGAPGQLNLALEPRRDTRSLFTARMATGAVVRGRINTGYSETLLLTLPCSDCSGGPRPLKNTTAAGFGAGPVAPDSIVAAFGRGLSTRTAAAQTSPPPFVLGGTAVTVRDAGGTERAAGLFFVSPEQVNYLMPAGTVPGTAAVTILAADGVVSKGTVEVASLAPGVFTLNGNGLAAATILRVRADNSRAVEQVVLRDSHFGDLVPAPIDFGPETDTLFLTLYGTGIRRLGALGDVRLAAFPEDLPALFAGPQGAYPGLDQVNVQLPRTLAGRGDIDMVLSVNGKPANIVRIRTR